MFTRKLLIPSVMSLIYVLLCIMAFAFHITRHETGKFSAMFIAVLTLPWSFVAVIFTSIIEITTKYEFKYMGNNIILLICAIANTILIFKIIKKILSKRR